MSTIVLVHPGSLFGSLSMSGDAWNRHSRTVRREINRDLCSADEIVVARGRLFDEFRASSLHASCASRGADYYDVPPRVPELRLFGAAVANGGEAPFIVTGAWATGCIKCIATGIDQKGCPVSISRRSALHPSEEPPDLMEETVEIQ